MPVSTRRTCAPTTRLLPLYELCQKLGVPAFVTSGPTTPDLRLNDPFVVDRVAKLFPGLPPVCCHGFYPHVAEMLTVALRNENVLVAPDLYTFAPARPARRRSSARSEGSAASSIGPQARRRPEKTGWLQRRRPDVDGIAAACRLE